MCAKIFTVVYGDYDLDYSAIGVTLVHFFSEWENISYYFLISNFSLQIFFLKISILLNIEFF